MPESGGPAPDGREPRRVPEPGSTEETLRRLEQRLDQGFGGGGTADGAGGSRGGARRRSGRAAGHSQGAGNPVAAPGHNQGRRSGRCPRSQPGAGNPGPGAGAGDPVPGRAIRVPGPAIGSRPRSGSRAGDPGPGAGAGDPGPGAGRATTRAHPPHPRRAGGPGGVLPRVDLGARPVRRAVPGHARPRPRPPAAPDRGAPGGAAGAPRADRLVPRTARAPGASRASRSRTSRSSSWRFPRPYNRAVAGSPGMSEGRTASAAAQRVGSGTTRLVRAWKALPGESRLAAYASGALFFTLFLPWSQVTLIAPAKTKTLQSATPRSPAGGGVSFVEAAVLLVAAGVLTLLFQRAEGRAFHLPGGDGGVIFAAGLWTCLLIIWRIFDKQGATTAGPSATTSGIEWGIFVALGAAAFLAYAGSRIRAAHRPEPPLPGEDAPPAGSSAAATVRATSATAATRRPATRRPAARESSARDSSARDSSAHDSSARDSSARESSARDSGARESSAGQVASTPAGERSRARQASVPTGTRRPVPPRRRPRPSPPSRRSTRPPERDAAPVRPPNPRHRRPPTARAGAPPPPSCSNASCPRTRRRCRSDEPSRRTWTPR